MLASSDIPGRCDTPSAAATTWAIVSSSAAAASSQNHAPSRNRGSTSAATCTARRVLPTPPVPVSVTRRALVQRRRRAPRSSSARPTNDVSCTGRLPGNASSDRSGGNVDGRRGMRHLEDLHRLGEITQQVLTQIDDTDLRCQPVTHQHLHRVRDTPPARRAPPTSTARTGSAARSRTRPSGRSVPSPVCRPIRARNAPTSPQASSRNASCASTDAVTAPTADANTAAIPSPISRQHHAVVRARPRPAGSRRGAPTLPASRPDAPPTGASNSRGR